MSIQCSVTLFRTGWLHFIDHFILREWRLFPMTWLVVSIFELSRANAIMVRKEAFHTH